MNEEDIDLYTDIIIPITISKGKRKNGIVTKVKRVQLSDYMICVDSFFTIDECNKWIEYGAALGFELVSHPATKDIAYRNHYRIQINDENTASKIFDRIHQILPDSMKYIDNKKAVGCSDNIRIYKYDSSQPNQSFGLHIDESNNHNGKVSKCTVLIYLSNVEAGKTLFYSGHGKSLKLVNSIEPLVGRLLIHGHGHRCLLHEGEVVTKGIKYCLRTDILYS
jgi:hypothetical protein